MKALAERHAELATVCALAAILLAPFLPILMFPGGRVLGEPQCDNPSAFYYYNYFCGHSWRAGETPLWNPYIMMGMPMLAEGEMAAFHPLSALFVALPTGAAINWLIALCVVSCGLFCYGYLRALGLGLRASFCGALAWGLSSALLSRIFAGHLNILRAHISLPLLLMCWERYRRGGEARYLAGLALGYAALIFSGNPQFTYIISLFVCVYVALQTALEFRNTAQARTALKTAAMAGLFFACGAGIGMIQLLPSMGFARESFRWHTSMLECGASSFAPEYLLTLLCPRFFGSTPLPGPDLHWGRWFLWEEWVYIGIIPLVAAAAGIMTAPIRQRITLAVCAALFFILSFGQYSPLFPVLYYYAPFMDIFRAHARFIIPALFCLVTFGAYGMEAWFNGFAQGDGRDGRDEKNETPEPSAMTRGLAERNESWGRSLLAGWDFRATVIWAALLLGMTYALFLYLTPDYASPGSHWQRFLTQLSIQSERYGPVIDTRNPSVLGATAVRATDQMIRAMALLSAAIALLFLSRVRRFRKALFPILALILIADMAGFFMPFLKTYDEQITGYPESFVKVFKSIERYPARVLDLTTFPNKPVRYDLSSIRGHVASALRRFNDFINSSQGKPLDEPQDFTQIERVTDVHKLLAIDYLVLPESQAPPLTPALATQEGCGIFRHSGAYPRAFMAEAPMSLSTAGAAPMNAGPVKAAPVEATQLDAAPVEAAPIEAGETVEFVRFQRSRVEMTAKANRPRVLVLNEVYDKDWTASINGKRTQVYRANYLFRAIVIPPGQSRIIFKYQPRAFTIGAWISGLSLAALIAMILALANSNARTRVND
ncbi:MAG: YfhO family protein [Candidatus Sumerlaeota bacterium]|nr:YfhO family protein [Candidatus Sumerlaeota bacterium]